MKVLMVNTPASTKFRGGDTTQMHKTAEALKEHDVEVAFSTEPEPDAEGYDLAHVFNLRTIEATSRQVQALKRYGIPIVMSPIYLNPSLALWGTRAIEQIFAAPPKRTDDELAEGLKHLRDRTIQFRGPNGQMWTAHGQNRTQPKYDDLERAILEHVDHLVPNSLLEMDALVKTLRVYDIPFTIAPYGVDPKIFLDADPEPFLKKHGLKDFVLQVGRVEKSKNQLMTAHALRDLDVPLVFIGGTLQPEYLGLCQLYGPSPLSPVLGGEGPGVRGLTVIPHLPPEELASAYAAAKVHVLPSWIETCGLVTLEAALAGCSVVVSFAGYELEYVRDLAYYCDPADPASIRNAVTEALQNYDQDQEQRGLLRELILREWTWENAAVRTLEAYKRVL